MQNLLSQVQLGKYGAVTLYIGFLEIVEQAAALTNHLQKAATGVVVLLMLLKVLVKVVDAIGKQSYLYLG